PGLAYIEEGDADHQIGEEEDALHEGKGAVAMQRAANIRSGAGMAIEEHILPRDQHIVEDDERVDLVEPARDRIFLERPAPGEAAAADMLHAGRAHQRDEADGII